MTSRFPFSYPNGWFVVAYSDEVAPGELKPLRYFGQDLVLFRTVSGQAQVLDAHCVHLGANLGVGGHVVGECIRCPFHAWTYGTDGACVEIPYAARIPRGAHVRSWPTEERSGLVLVWHHHRAAAPMWEPPDLVEHDDPDWVGYHRYCWQVRTHPQDIDENLFDPAHFASVHGNTGGMPPAQYTFRDHMVEIILDNHIAVLGVDVHHEIVVFGLGLTRTRSVGGGAKSWWGSNTPIDEEMTDVRFSLMTPKSRQDDPTGALSRKSAEGSAMAFAQDVPIWENKVYRASPLLCDGDGPIGRFRRWAQQFYPEILP
jgi:3-ketosteroid 9alpha-monooxygenase subunit A